MIASVLGVVLGNLISWTLVAASSTPEFASDGIFRADLIVPRKCVGAFISESIHKAAPAKFLTFHFELAVAALRVTLGTVV